MNLATAPGSTMVEGASTGLPTYSPHGERARWASEVQAWEDRLREACERSHADQVVIMAPESSAEQTGRARAHQWLADGAAHQARGALMALDQVAQRMGLQRPATAVILEGMGMPMLPAWDRLRGQVVAEVAS